MKAKPRTYSQGYVDQMRGTIRELNERNAWQATRVEDAVREQRRYEQLLDTRWDEMQRLRDLIFAIATKSSPRNVVEREIDKLAHAPKEKTS